MLFIGNFFLILDYFLEVHEALGPTPKLLEMRTTIDQASIYVNDYTIYFGLFGKYFKYR